MNTEEGKMICGLALENAYLHQSNTISKLGPIWRDPQINQIESLSDELVVSRDFSAHGIGFLVQAVIQNDLPDPDSVQWRDLALELCEQRVLLVDIMYRVRELAETEQLLANKQALSRSINALREWQACIGEAVLAMRSSNWITAKISLYMASIVSRSRDLAALVKDYPDFGGAIKIHKNEASIFRNKVMEYPSKIRIPRERIATILRVQSLYLRLLIWRNASVKDDRMTSIVTYPIEKLRAAIDFLLSPKTDVEVANYEIGLAASHMQERTGEIQLSPVGKQLRNISRDLEEVFSTLPARPWPMEGFGSPAVEARFKPENAP